MCVCVFCVMDRICVWAVIILDRICVVTHVLITSLCIVSIEACVSTVEARFGGAGCTRACVGRLHVCGFSPVILDHMSHIVIPFSFNQRSPVTICNRFYESGVSGVTS